MATLHAGAVELHRIAKQLLPTVPDLEGHIAVKPSHVVIAVERHDQDSEHWEEPKDRFLWVKGRSKVKIQRIRESYITQSLQADLSVTLKLGESAPHDDSSIGDLDIFYDQLIVLAAEEANSTRPANQLHRSPRQPLQPVIRQLTVPTMQSAQDRSGPLKTRSPAPEIKPEMSSLAEDDPTGLSNPPLSSATPTTSPVASSVNRETNATQVTEPTETTGVKPERSASPEYQPRNYDNPFESHEEERDIPARGQPLRQLAQDTSPERLEAGLTAGIQVLAKLKEPLEKLTKNPDALSWLEQIEKVRADAKKTRTVVGVVGNTGAGKSSVINAILDEERLVPTNCMRACTAVGHGDVI